MPFMNDNVSQNAVVHLPVTAEWQCIPECSGALTCDSGVTMYPRMQWCTYLWQRSGWVLEHFLPYIHRHVLKRLHTHIRIIIKTNKQQTSGALELKRGISCFRWKVIVLLFYSDCINNIFIYTCNNYHVQYDTMITFSHRNIIPID